MPLLLPLMLHLGGCHAPADTMFPTGSQTIVGSPDGESVYVVDEDTQALVRYDAKGETLVEVALDAVPGRVARAGHTVWVTLPAERAIAVLTEGLGGLRRTGTLETGAEPLGLVARADGERLYVALATSGEVRELTTSGEVLRTWHVDGLPSWLALRPDGDGLYVGAANGGGLTWIDLVSGAAHAVPLPSPLLAGDDGDGPFSRRITGDLSVSDDGTLLAVPILLVDNFTQVDAPTPNDPVTNGYSSGNDSGMAGLSRFNPAVAFVELDAAGQPDGPGAALVLVAAADLTGMVVRSYLSSVTLAPGGEMALATMEASDSVIALSTTPSTTAGFAVSASVVVMTASGPRGVAFLDEGTAYVDCFVGRQVLELSADDLRERLGTSFRSSGFELDGVDYSPSPLAPNVLDGRRLFHSAVEPTMAASGAGVSCSTCHPAGRNDGLSWNLEDGDRQTPSLAGGIAASAPFTWASGVRTVPDEVSITSQGRMGGEGLSLTEADLVAEYVESVRGPDVPARASTDPAIARGAAVFARPDVGCAGCHTGALLTDNASWPLFGLDEVNTPALRGLAATAPYLHDGRAASLRDLLLLSVDGAMGDTSGLSDDELDDLEAYLASL